MEDLKSKIYLGDDYIRVSDVLDMVESQVSVLEEMRTLENSGMAKSRTLYETERIDENVGIPEDDMRRYLDTERIYRRVMLWYSKNNVVEVNLDNVSDVRGLINSDKIKETPLHFFVLRPDMTEKRLATDSALTCEHICIDDLRFDINYFRDIVLAYFDKLSGMDDKLSLINAIKLMFPFVDKINRELPILTIEH